MQYVYVYIYILVNIKYKVISFELKNIMSMLITTVTGKYRYLELRGPQQNFRDVRGYEYVYISYFYFIPNSSTIHIRVFNFDENIFVCELSLLMKYILMFVKINEL